MTSAPTQTENRRGADEATRKQKSQNLSDETLLKWLADMMLIREFETRTMQAYSNAKIGGFLHVYSGQEACAVAMMACVDKEDPVITAYRDHGHALARGMDPKACMAEMFGKLEGCAKGKGGSMHMFDRPNQLYGGHGIVGAHTPLGAGLAFGAKYQREVMQKGEGLKRVVLCYLGDGALNQGAFHEAMNLAGLLSLPVAYIVENNGYAMGTSVKRGTTMANDLLKKSEPYGIQAVEADGLNSLEIYDTCKPFLDEMREEQKPGFIHLKTYRYFGHSMSDPQKYRTKDEVNKHKENDPIDHLSHHLMEERDCLSEEDHESMQKEARSRAKEAMEYAEGLDPIDVEKELYSDVFLDPLPQMSPIRDYVQGAPNPLLGEEGGE